MPSVIFSSKYPINSNQQLALKKILSFKRIDNYYQNIIYLTDFQIKKIEDRCLEWKTSKEYIFNINYKNIKTKYLFIIYLTKKTSRRK